MSPQRIQRKSTTGVDERARWCVANLLNRLPGQCWTDLVSWALDGSRAARRRGDNPLPWRPITDLCRKDAGENDGRCYCSKICPRKAVDRA